MLCNPSDLSFLSSSFTESTRFFSIFLTYRINNNNNNNKFILVFFFLYNAILIRKS